ncbi:hypothetical protein CFAM422_000802 [Trichoderma lentiforme]|uniref:Uncharacterized protein n=1 Tax=Trichoderma lentiforme TaxID=1567552 RepID=A0A9P4XPE2_9HYPO|nr:hypothetical protein CFAM422_000802 [Trichoderma lentiforme]
MPSNRPLARRSGHLPSPPGWQFFSAFAAALLQAMDGHVTSWDRPPVVELGNAPRACTVQDRSIAPDWA